MVKNTSLSEFKSVICHINAVVLRLMQEVCDNVDGDNISYKSVNNLKNKIIKLSEICHFVIMHAEELETFIIESEKFTNLRLRLDEINSLLCVIKILIDMNGKLFYKLYFDDLLSVLFRITRFSVEISKDLSSEDIDNETLKIFAKFHNNIRIF